MILDLLNKIKWDNNENPDIYEFFYRDKDKIKSFKFNNIEHIHGTFISKYNEDKEIIDIPIHRIKTITKNGEIILKRR